MFNNENTEWKEGKYSLFLGQEPALYDSINVTHPKLFELYKRQKSTDWSEDELSLEQSRIDMQSCPEEVRDIMVKNLSLQWEADSIASRAIAPLFAPFITNSELWAAWLKVSEIEVLHALTYSEIVRQCIPKPEVIFTQIMENEEITGRLAPISQAFKELRIEGALHIIGESCGKQHSYNKVMNAVVALYCLERLQFQASFAATFAVVDQGWFQAIGKLVQKIAQDERFIHAEIDEYVIKHELSTEMGKAWIAQYFEFIRSMIDAVVQAEYNWAEYLFSEGRKVVGLNEQTLKDWVDFNAQDVYTTLGFEVKKIKNNPLKLVDNWFDLNKNQNAQQEADSANYLLNIIVNDIREDDVFEYERN
jgi:ribonucleoside-diphosphate reductase beta chain